MREYRTPLPGLLASSLEAGVNRLLSVDAQSADRLARLDGRRVNLTIEDLAITLQFAFTSYRVQVGLNTEEEADTSISGSMPALFAMAVPDEEGRWGGPGSRVKISGDATLARDVERLFSRLDLDFDRGLAHFFGDVLGHQLATGLRGLQKQMKRAGGEAQQMTGEFLLSEQSPLAQPGEIRLFNDDVDNLRDATDRMEARIRLLKDKLNNTEASG